MAWIDDFRQFVQQPEVAGTAGSIMSLRWLPVGSSWGNKVTSFLSGLSIAVWLVPLAVELFGMKSQGGIGAFGFMGGLFGLLLVSRAWEYIATTPAGEWLTALFTRRPS